MNPDTSTPSLPPNDTKNTTTNDKQRSNLFTFNRFFLKAKYSLYSALVFFLFANPETSLILQRFFGKFVDFITPCGAPTITGIFVSTGLFFVTMLGLMLLPSE
jgi:hypothetical protein